MMRIFTPCVVLALLWPAAARADVCATYQTRTDRQEWGKATLLQRVAQPFTVDADCTITGAGISVQLSGSPGDNATIDIYSDAGGQPGSLIEAGSTIPAATWNSAASSFATSTFSGVNTLLSGTTYWLRLGRTGSNDDSNYYYEDVGNTAPVYGDAVYYNGSSWSSIGAYNFVFNIEGDVAPPPIPGDSGATSSPDQTQQNLSTAFALFFVAMFGTIWLMRKH